MAHQLTRASTQADGVRAVTELEFERYQRMIQHEIGIFLPKTKMPLLSNRIAKRLQARGCSDFSQYFSLIEKSKEKVERQLALDLITTNETYFFREPKHFDYLEQWLSTKQKSSKGFDVWSAACSSGEEPYSLAMVLAEYCPMPWRILASDVSQRTLEKAKLAIYADKALEKIEKSLQKKYCLAGSGPYQGTIRIRPSLRDRIDFCIVNLSKPLPGLKHFDLIVLRNMLIYFEKEDQAAIIKRVSQQLKPGGHLFVGHSESLQGIDHGLQNVRPSIYLRPES